MPVPPNWPFIGSPAGGRSTVVANSLIETAKLKVRTPAWLAGVPARIPGHEVSRLDDPMPWHATWPS